MTVNQLVMLTDLYFKSVMAKSIVLCCFFLFVAQIGVAQISTGSPFKKLPFINSPTDTVTLFATYTGVTDSLTSTNRDIINTIKRHGGREVKNATYTINLKLANYPEALSIVSTDGSMINTLKTNLGTNDQISIKCVVYRFYFIDGVCNFFYITKVDQVGKRI